jgi:glycosyltransferase involved in cell wall biosynthesis
MILVLFTASYPYVLGEEQNFLEIEIRHLALAFNRVILVPQTCKAQPLELPQSVEVDTSYADLLSSYGSLATLFRGVFSPLFKQDIAGRPSLLLYPVALKRLAFCAGRAELTRRWALAWLKEQNLDGRNCLFYTYWFDQAAVGGALVKQQFPNLKLVSRAHGYDIYDEEYYNPPYWPCRRFVFSRLDHLFPASQNGAEYLRKRYREYISPCDHAHLGVVDPGVVTRPSNDGVFRVVSCSMLVQLKRVDLLLDSICFAALSRPDQKFEWHHIGNGDKRDEFQQRADEILPPNAGAYFHPYVDGSTLMKFYRDTPIDVFINLSRTEGGAPVSIMEAISCGIPVIATAVGGNPEIVSEQNGCLVSANPKPEEVADAIFSLIDNPSIAMLKRIESRKVWESRFNADVNFSKFAKKLRLIRSGP